MIKIFDAGYDKFHLIGFSLGGQISGVIGRSVKYQTNDKYIIQRITGLDPGQLPPISFLAIQELNAGDATFVDTIHGETKLFGSSKSLGNASFWVNGGIYQPSCNFKISLRKMPEISTNLIKMLTICISFQSHQYVAI